MGMRGPAFNLIHGMGPYPWEMSNRQEEKCQRITGRMERQDRGGFFESQSDIIRMRDLQERRAVCEPGEEI